MRRFAATDSLIVLRPCDICHKFRSFTGFTRPFWPGRCRPAEGARRLPKRTAVAGGPPRTIGHILDGPMWYGFANSDRRPATGGLRPARPMRAPTTNLSGLSGHLPYKGRHNDERPTNYDERQALTGTIVGAVPTGGPPRTIGYTPIRSMWHGFATCDLRPATGAPYKGRPRPTNLSGLLGHLPYKGRHNDERIAEGDKPRATNH